MSTKSDLLKTEETPPDFKEILQKKGFPKILYVVLLGGGSFLLALGIYLFVLKEPRSPSPHSEIPSPSPQPLSQRSGSTDTIYGGEEPGTLGLYDSLLMHQEDSLLKEELPPVTLDEIQSIVSNAVSDSELKFLKFPEGWKDEEIAGYEELFPGKSGEQIHSRLTSEDSLKIAEMVWGRMLDSLVRSNDSLRQLYHKSLLTTDSLEKVVKTSKMSGRRGLETTKDTLREARVKRLAKMIEAMNPQSAAQMMANYSPEEVTEILYYLKPRAAARLLEAMPSTLSSEVAKRIGKK